MDKHELKEMENEMKHFMHIYIKFARIREQQKAQRIIQTCLDATDKTLFA